MEMFRKEMLEQNWSVLATLPNHWMFRALCLGLLVPIYGIPLTLLVMPVIRGCRSSGSSGTE